MHEAGPAYLHPASLRIVGAVGGTPALAAQRVVARVVGSGSELPDAVGDLDGETVVQVARQDKDRLAQRVPEPDQLLPLLQKNRPGLILVGDGLRPIGPYVRDGEVDRGDHEKQVGLAGFHLPLQPILLWSADHGKPLFPGLPHVVHHAMAAGVQEEEVGIADGLPKVRHPPDGVGGLAVGPGGRPDLQPVGVQDLHDPVHPGIGIAALGVAGAIHDAGIGRAPVHVQGGRLPGVQAAEVGFRIGQDGTSGAEGGPSEQNVLGRIHRIAPAQIVIPGFQSDVAEDGTPVAETHLSRSVDVVDDLVIVEGEEGGDHPMPVGQVLSPVEIELVVLPHAHDVGHHLHHLRRLPGGEAYLPQPVLGRVPALLLIQPVPVENCEVDPRPTVGALKFSEHGGEGGQAPSEGARTAGILVVAAGKLESEIEASFRIVLGMAHVVGAGQGLEGSPRPRDFLRPIQPDQPVVVSGSRIQAGEVNPTGVVPLDSSLRRR